MKSSLPVTRYASDVNRRRFRCVLERRAVVDHTLYAGIVGWFKSILTHGDAVAGHVVTTITARAPAEGVADLVEKVQMRERSAILPGRSVESAPQAVPARGRVDRGFSQTPRSVKVARHEREVPLTPAAVTGPTVIGLAMMTDAAAPAVSARVADPGDSIVKWPGPELPGRPPRRPIGAVQIVDGDCQRSLRPNDPDFPCRPGSYDVEPVRIGGVERSGMSWSVRCRRCPGIL